MPKSHYANLFKKLHNPVFLDNLGLLQ